jgi:hypothetical protein
MSTTAARFSGKLFAAACLDHSDASAEEAQAVFVGARSPTR